jgi:hypothetical protein
MYLDFSSVKITPKSELICHGRRGSGGSGGVHPATTTRSRKACESGRGRKTPQERGEDPLPMGAVNKHAGQRKRVQCHLPQCTWKGESLQQRLTHRRTLSKQSLWGQVSAKLTPEICINNGSSNSRLTAAGRQATAADTILRTVSRLFVFFFFLVSLPTSDEKTTKLYLHAEKLTEIVLHLNLRPFVGLCFLFLFFFVCSFVLLYASPMMRQLQNNI